MPDYAHMLDLNKILSFEAVDVTCEFASACVTQMNSSDEQNFLSGAAKMPSPCHLDESVSDSIVSSKF